MAAEQSAVITDGHAPEISHRTTLLVRYFGWAVLSQLCAFLLNNYLTFWMDWPGEGAALGIGRFAAAVIVVVQAELGAGLLVGGASACCADDRDG